MTTGQAWYHQWRIAEWSGTRWYVPLSDYGNTHKEEGSPEWRGPILPPTK